MIPNPVIIIANIIFTVATGLAIGFYFSLKPYFYSFWFTIFSIVLLILICAAYYHNGLYQKNEREAQIPDVVVSISPITDRFKSANFTEYKYPLSEYSLLIYNNNKNSVPIYNCYIEFAFPYNVSKIEGSPILRTTGRRKIIESNVTDTIVTEDLPEGKILNDIYSLEVLKKRQGDNTVNLNRVNFICKNWSGINAYEGKIIINLENKAHDVGKFSGTYNYSINNKEYSEIIPETFFNSNFSIIKAEHHYLRGKNYESAKNFSLAITEYEKAIGLQSDHKDAYFHKALSHIMIDEYKNGIFALDKLLSISPNYVDAYLNRASSKAKLEQYDEAIKDYSVFINKRPIDADGYFGRALTYAHKKEYKNAIIDCEKALEFNISPDKHATIAKIYFNGSNYLNNEKHSLRKKEWLDKAIELNPNYADAYINRGNYHHREGNHRKAIIEFTEAIKINCALPEAYINRAFVYKSEGELDKAANDFKKACDLGIQIACKEYERLVSK